LSLKDGRRGITYNLIYIIYRVPIVSKVETKSEKKGDEEEKLSNPEI
jgi:hypothetical protein